MNKRGFRGAALALAISASILMASTSFAVNRGGKQDGGAFIVSRWAYKRLAAAHEAINKKQYKTALGKLNELGERPSLTEHEKALMHQTKGHVYSMMGNAKKAAASLEACIKNGALPETNLLDTQYNLGQIYLADSRYNKAISTLVRWFTSVKNPAPKANYLLAHAYREAGKPKMALVQARTALARNRKAPDSWIQLVLSLHVDLKQFKQAVPLLIRLVERNPSRKNYWIQLAAAYSESKDPARALAVQELIYKQGLYTEGRDLKNLAQSYLYNNIPFKAAEVVEKAIADKKLEASVDNLKMLGSAWLQARERDRAVKPLQRAAKKSSRGEPGMLLAQVYLEREDWPRASTTISAALKKKLEKKGKAYLLLGIARQQQGKPDLAKRAFKKATGFKTTKAAAVKWLKFLKKNAANS